jgi:hypothetical protein
MTRRTWLISLYVLVCMFVYGDAWSETSNMESLVPKETPDGWVLMNAPKVFSKDTLFEHINGQADLFLQYGYQRSIFAVYQNANSSRQHIDLDMYDMGNVTQAFGIFSRFRQADHSGGIGLDSYQDDRTALFYKGKYFVILQATESSPASLKQLAQMIASKITDNSPPPKEIGYFPRNELKPGSIEYYPQGLMGRQALKRGFKATYQVPDKPGTKPEPSDDKPDSSLFIAIFDSTGEAEGALKNLKEDLSKRRNAQAIISTQPGFEMVRGQDVYQGRLIIVRKGRYLAGAAGFERENEAESLLAELVKRIK